MNFSLTKISGNKKTGSIPVSVSHRDTCPDSCKLKRNGCYAENFHTQIHWNKVTSGERGVSWNKFLEGVKSLDKRGLWRHNVSGDLVGAENKICSESLEELTKANRGKRGFSFTHYPHTKPNIAAVAQACKNGFTVNLSCDSIQEGVKAFKKFGLPTVVIVAEDQPKVTMLDGVKTVICPAQTNETTTCKTCGLCSKTDREYLIGFQVHGTTKKKAVQAINIKLVGEVSC